MERSIQEHMGNIIMKREDAANPRRLPEGKTLKMSSVLLVYWNLWDVVGWSWEVDRWELGLERKKHGFSLMPEKDCKQQT